MPVGRTGEVRGLCPARGFKSRRSQPGRFPGSSGQSSWQTAITAGLLEANTFLGTMGLSETKKQAALATVTWGSGNKPPTAHTSLCVGDDQRWRISEGVRHPSCSESGTLRARGVQAAVNTGMDPPGPSYLDHSWTHSSDFPQK